MIQNLKLFNTQNTGDLYCSPLNYLFQKEKIKQLCIHQLNSTRNFILYDQSKPIVVGGGGLLYWKNQKENWYPLIQYILETKKKPCILWGAGLNHYNDINPNLIIKKFDLIGIRDYLKSYKTHWVPCASCLYDGFSTKQDAINEFVVYEHYENPININNYPKIQNNRPINETINFLNSSEVVLTNTYHGIYWSMLLEKKVIFIKDNFKSNRMSYLRYPIIKCELNNFKENLKSDCVIYNDFLQECREVNLKFFDKAKNLIN